MVCIRLAKDRDKWGGGVLSNTEITILVPNETRKSLPSFPSRMGSIESVTLSVQEGTYSAPCLRIWAMIRFMH